MRLVPGRGSVKSTEKVVGIVVIIIGELSLTLRKGFNTGEQQPHFSPVLHVVLFQFFYTNEDPYSPLTALISQFIQGLA